MHRMGWLRATAALPLAIMVCLCCHAAPVEDSGDRPDSSTIPETAATAETAEFVFVAGISGAGHLEVVQAMANSLIPEHTTIMLHTPLTSLVMKLFGSPNVPARMAAERQLINLIKQLDRHASAAAETEAAKETLEAEAEGADKGSSTATGSSSDHRHTLRKGKGGKTIYILNGVMAPDPRLALAFPMANGLSGRKEHGPSVDTPYLLRVFAQAGKNLHVIFLPNRPHQLLSFEKCPECELSGSALRLVEDVLRMIKTQLIATAHTRPTCVQTMFSSIEECQAMLGTMPDWLPVDEAKFCEALANTIPSDLSPQLPTPELLEKYPNTFASVWRALQHLQGLCKQRTQLVDAEGKMNFGQLFLSSPSHQAADQANSRFAESSAADDNAKASTSRRNVFVVGPEGSSHHLWSTLFQHCPVCVSAESAAFEYKMFQVKTRLLSNVAKAENHANTLNSMLHCLAHGHQPKETCPSLDDTPQLKAQQQLIVFNTLIPQTLGSQPLGLGMMSYPNFGAPSKNLRHPDVSQLYHMSNQQGQPLSSVVLVRQPRQMVISISIHRHFGKFPTQTMRVTQQLQIIIGQLLETDAGSMACFDYNSEIDEYCNGLQRALGVDADDWDVCKTLKLVKISKKQPVTPAQGAALEPDQGTEANRVHENESGTASSTPEDYDDDDQQNDDDPYGDKSGSAETEDDTLAEGESLFIDDEDKNTSKSGLVGRKPLWREDRSSGLSGHTSVSGRLGRRPLSVGSVHHKVVKLTEEQEWLLLPSETYYVLLQGLCEYSAGQSP